MKRYINLFLIFGLLIAFSLSANVYGAEIAQNYQFDTAVRLARVLDRQFVFSFVSASCPHCQDFKEEILSAPKVKKELSQHYILSLVSVDETFELTLPERGKVTNMQLASGLGLQATPTTFVFYPPDPGLKNRGITKFQGNPPSPEAMVDFLTRIGTEAFKEEEGQKDEEEGSGFYNYKEEIKALSPEDYSFLKSAAFDIPVIEERVSLSSIPEVPEIVLDLPEASGRDFAGKVLSNTEVKKVFIVEEEQNN